MTSLSCSREPWGPWLFSYEAPSLDVGRKLQDISEVKCFWSMILFSIAPFTTKHYLFENLAFMTRRKQTANTVASRGCEAPCLRLKSCYFAVVFRLLVSACLLHKFEFISVFPIQPPSGRPLQSLYWDHAHGTAVEFINVFCWCDQRVPWRGGPNTRTLPTVLLPPPPSKAVDMAHLCIPQNQALGVCRGRPNTRTLPTVLPLHHQAWQPIWLTCVSLKTKLWGSAEDLFLTSKYAALKGERI